MQHPLTFLVLVAGPAERGVDLGVGFGAGFLHRVDGEGDATDAGRDRGGDEQRSTS